MQISKTRILEQSLYLQQLRCRRFAHRSDILLLESRAYRAHMVMPLVIASAAARQLLRISRCNCLLNYLRDCPSGAYPEEISHSYEELENTLRDLNVNDGEARACSDKRLKARASSSFEQFLCFDTSFFFYCFPIQVTMK